MCGAWCVLVRASLSVPVPVPVPVSVSVSVPMSRERVFISLCCVIPSHMYTQCALMLACHKARKRLRVHTHERACVCVSVHARIPTCAMHTSVISFFS